MPSKLKLVKLLFLLLLVFPESVQPQKDEPKNILFIFSWNQGLVAYQILLENFKNILGEEYSEPYKLYVEYLNIGDFPDTTYQKYVFDRINEKYKGIPIDLLVLEGPNVVPLIETYAADYIKNLPTISNDIYNPFDPNFKYSLNNNTVEILEYVDIKKNFELAFSLFPKCSTVYIISGTSQADQFFYKLTMIAAQKYEKQKKIVSLVNLSMEEVLRGVKSIPKECVILIPTFLADINNVNYYTPEAIRLIRKNTSAPIFVLFDTVFEDGAFGGYVSSQAAVGIECGRVAVKILNGQNPNTIQVNPEDLRRYMFDYRELKRWGLEDSEFIPANSIILHKERSFFEDHKWFLVGILLFITLQTLLIVNLVTLNRKQRLTAVKLRETESHFRELSREDRILRMGELTASLSHELNQPLTAIRSSAQAGLRFMKTNKLDTATMEEILNNIVEDDKRAADVLSSIRQLMRLEKREKQKIDLNLKIHQVVEILRGELTNENIKLNLGLFENPVYVLGDRTQIQQVLLNFISNAIHVESEVESGKKIIDITEQIENEKVTISIRDYGYGIDESIKSKLFKPFFTTRENGSGIGLAISKSIIDEHNGKIWAENNLDGGATFSFQLSLWNDGKN